METIAAVFFFSRLWQPVATTVRVHVMHTSF